MRTREIKPASNSNSDPLSKSAIKRLLRKKNRLQRRLRETSETIFRLEGKKEAVSGRSFASSIVQHRSRYTLITEELFSINQKIASVRISLERSLRDLQDGESGASDGERKRHEKMLKLLAPESAHFNARLLFRLAAGVLAVWAILAAGFLSYKKIFSGSTASTLSEPVARTETAASSAPPSADSVEIIFDIIRAANMRKDIDLYASCFSHSFTSMDERKKRMIKNWKDYEVADLKFTLGPLSISRDRADVTVKWKVNARCLRTGDLEVFHKTQEVGLTNENGMWRIASLK